MNITSEKAVDYLDGLRHKIRRACHVAANLTDVASIPVYTQDMLTLSACAGLILNLTAENATLTACLRIHGEGPSSCPACGERLVRAD